MSALYNIHFYHLQNHKSRCATHLCDYCTLLRNIVEIGDTNSLLIHCCNQRYNRSRIVETWIANNKYFCSCFCNANESFTSVSP